MQYTPHTMQPDASGRPLPSPMGEGDQREFGEYAQRLLADLSGAMVSVICGLGGKLGLFRALAEGPCTSAELAERTGLDERYVREWLHCLASAGYLHADPDTGRFELPSALVYLLATESPLNLTGAHALVLALADTVDTVADAMRSGTGVAPDAYSESLYQAMEQMSASWLDFLLVAQFIPAVPGLVDRLAEGARVADIGCGHGRALIRLAQRFPRSEYIGVDSHPAVIARAAAAVRDAGVAERVTLLAADATKGLPGTFDLITMFNVLHDARDPESVLRAVRAALTSDGAVLLMESRAADTPWDNKGRRRRFSTPRVFSSVSPALVSAIDMARARSACPRRVFVTWQALRDSARSGRFRCRARSTPCTCYSREHAGERSHGDSRTKQGNRRKADRGVEPQRPARTNGVLGSRHGALRTRWGAGRPDGRFRDGPIHGRVPGDSHGGAQPRR